MLTLSDKRSKTRGNVISRIVYPKYPPEVIVGVIGFLLIVEKDIDLRSTVDTSFGIYFTQWGDKFFSIIGFNSIAIVFLSFIPVNAEIKDKRPSEK